MQINVIGCSIAGKAQESFKRFDHEVFVFDPYVFPDIGAPQTKLDLSFLCTLRNFAADAVKNRKLVSKDFLCAFITFRNKADCLINRLELNNSEVARLVCADAQMARCGTSKFGQPYRGKCLPTCICEWINAFCRKGLNSMLFEAVGTYNLRIGKRHANT